MYWNKTMKILIIIANGSRPVGFPFYVRLSGHPVFILKKYSKEYQDDVNNRWKAVIRCEQCQIQKRETFPIRTSS